MKYKDNIVILDCGSQYTQLIARRVRELEVYSEILPHDAAYEEIISKAPKGIIISGGPRSSNEHDAPKLDERLLHSHIPILGICYGMQMLAVQLGGKVTRGESAEYGKAQVSVTAGCALLGGIEGNFDVWMSHWDVVKEVPKGANIIAISEKDYAGFEMPSENIYALQFHPEVAHTQNGNKILSNFLYRICAAARSWKLDNFIETSIEEIKEKVGSSNVLCGLSGGVDSTVAAVLTSKAVGAKLDCVFVDNGLLRKDEAKSVLGTYKQLDLKVHFEDASEEFLTALRGVTEPEAKRKAIGRTFIEIFESCSAKHVKNANIQWLLQGTLYPDVIESGHKGKGASVIKSHHNVGGLPDTMKMKVLEPLRDLFKDEVRRIGRLLGVPEIFISRQPFPGPGLAVRCLGDVSQPRLEILREADAIFQEEITKGGLYDELWQSFAVLLPTKSVGVMGDVRTYAQTAVLRAVTSQDGMTADWARLPYDLLDTTSRRICNEVEGINRVVLDITGKPPGTIEWE